MKNLRMFLLLISAVFLLGNPLVLAFGVVSSTDDSSSSSSDSSSTFGAGTKMTFHEAKLSTNSGLQTTSTLGVSSNTAATTEAAATDTSKSSFSTGSSFYKPSTNTSTSSGFSASSSASSFGIQGMESQGSTGRHVQLGQKDFEFGKTRLATSDGSTQAEVS